MACPTYSSQSTSRRVYGVPLIYQLAPTSTAEVYDTECDVYAPCAVGATLNADTIPRLRCRIVAGSANNQLGEEADAVRLHERGILYAPDYVVNAGGATAFAALAEGILEDAELRERVQRLGVVTAEILSEAAERNEPPLVAARRRVARVLKREASPAA